MSKLFLIFEISYTILLRLRLQNVNMERPEVEDHEEKLPNILGTLTPGITMAK